jgi:hypothetical protein
MGFLHKLLGRNTTNQAVEATCQPEVRAEDPLLAQLRESRAHRAEMDAQVEAKLARIRELGRRYPYTS